MTLLAAVALPEGYVGNEEAFFLCRAVGRLNKVWLEVGMPEEWFCSGTMWQPRIVFFIINPSFILMFHNTFPPANH